jgi:hypothetical protein
MYFPQEAETSLRHHAERTARLVEDHSRLRVPSGTGRTRWSGRVMRRTAA